MSIIFRALSAKIKVFNIFNRVSNMLCKSGCMQFDAEGRNGPPHQYIVSGIYFVIFSAAAIFSQQDGRNKPHDRRGISGLLGTHVYAAHTGYALLPVRSGRVIFAYGAGRAVCGAGAALYALLPRRGLQRYTVIGAIFRVPRHTDLRDGRSALRALQFFGEGRRHHRSNLMPCASGSASE